MDTRVAPKRSRSDASLGTFRSARPFGVRRGHAPRYSKGSALWAFDDGDWEIVDWEGDAEGRARITHND